MARICPHCGYEGTEERCPNDELPTIDPEVFELSEGAPALTGTVLVDRYRIEEQLGEGASGWVFRAHHLSTKQPAAIKILRRDLTRKMVALRRFYIEARSLANLNHPNIIRVYDFGASNEGHLYMAMEFLEGESLQDRIRQRGSCPPEDVIRFGIQIAGALELAHDSNIIHRDLKPANIHLCNVAKKTDVVKLLDFGLAKAIGDDELEVGITAAGFLVGSPGYIAPEQIMGQPTDGRADLYSLGITLYRCLTGRLPFSASKVEHIIREQLTEKPQPLPEEVDGTAIPSALRALIMRLIAVDPNDRFQSASDVLEALRDIESGRRPAFMAAFPAPDDIETRDRIPQPVLGSTKGRWVALAAAALVGLGLWVTLGGSDDPAPDAASEVVADSQPRPTAKQAGPVGPAAPEATPGAPKEEPSDAADAKEARTKGPSDKGVPDTPAADPPPLERLVLLNSSPQGLEVLDKDIVVGKTPLNVPLLEGQSRTLTVVGADGSKRDVVLSDETENVHTVTFELPKPTPEEPEKTDKKRKKKLKVKLL